MTMTPRACESLRHELIVSFRLHAAERSRESRVSRAMLPIVVVRLIQRRSSSPGSIFHDFQMTRLEARQSKTPKSLTVLFLPGLSDSTRAHLHFQVVTLLYKRLLFVQYCVSAHELNVPRASCTSAC